jgi:hypothetical protein
VISRNEQPKGEAERFESGAPTTTNIEIGKHATAALRGYSSEVDAII